MSMLKRRRTVFAAAGLLLAAAAIALAVGYLRTADAREFYFKAESNNFKKYSQWLEKNYTAFQEAQQPYKESAYRRRVEITADVMSGGNPFGLKHADRLSDLIKKSKLIVDTRRSPLEDTAVSDMSLLIEKAPFLDAEVFTEARNLYFTVPVLLPEKYFRADLNKIDEVYDKLSVPVRPKRLVNAADIAEALQFDEPAFDESLSALGAVFKEIISKDAVKYGQEREITISGQAVKGREVLVSLDEASATELLGRLASAAASNDTLISLTYGNFADLSAMLEDAGLFRLFDFLDKTGVVVLNESEKKLVERLNVKKDTEGFRKAITEGFSGYTLKDGMNMTLVIDRSGNILDRKLSLDLTATESGKSFKLDIHTGSSSTNWDDCRNRFAEIKVEQPDADSGSGSKTTVLAVHSVFQKANGTDLKGDITINGSVTSPDGGKSGADITLAIAGGTDATTLKRHDSIKYGLMLYGQYGDGNLDGELSMVSWKNKKLHSANRSVKLTAAANLPSFGIKDLSAEISLSGEDRLGIEPFALPDIQQGSVTDLNAATDSDLERIRMEVMASFGSFYLSNKPVFDAILGQ